MNTPTSSGRKTAPSRRETASWSVRLAVLALALAPSAAGAAPSSAAATPAAWSQGTKLCDAGKLQEGWDALAAIEKSAGKKPLPAAYWRDVLACAMKARMPAHALRAGKMLDAEKATTAADRALLEQARAAARPADPSRILGVGESWTVRRLPGEKVELVSTPCGFSVRPPADPPFLPVAQQGGCSVRIFGAKLKGKANAQQASIIVLARRAGPNQTPEDYARQLLSTWKPARIDGLRCPAAKCVGYGYTIPGMYGRDGDGIGVAIAFERDEPELPGLALEKPLSTVKPPDGGTPAGRYGGKLLYIIQHESASSVAKPARAELQQFLSGLVVE